MKIHKMILSVVVFSFLVACGGGSALIADELPDDSGATPSENDTVDCGDDTDGNGVGDTCQVLVPADCGDDTNANGVGDDCEVTVTVSVDECGDDLNGNTIGDACEVTVNVTVDECGDDLNANGIGDACEVEVPADCGEDLNANGVGDDCEVEVPAGPQVVINSFKATPGTQIFAGETLTLTYDVSEADTVYLNGDTLDGASGTLELQPIESETYLLWAGNDASAADKKLTVSVSAIEHLSGSKTYRFVKASPADSKVIFVGGDDGLYQSTDGGESFAIVSAVTQPVNCIAFDPSDADTVVIGTDGTNGTDGYVMVSHDGGANFTTTLTVGVSSNGPGVVFSSVAISPENSEHIYATYDYGLAYSSNGGAGWARIDEFGGKTVNAVLFAQNGDSYFGAADGLYQNTSDGFGRVALSGESVTALAWDDSHADSGKLLVGTAAGEVGTFENESYTKLMSGFEAIKGVAHLSSKDLFFVAASNGIFVSRTGAEAIKIQGNDDLTSVTGFDFGTSGSIKMVFNQTYRILLTGEGAGVSSLSWSANLFLFTPMLMTGGVIQDLGVAKVK
jgi:hypothetical protein